MKYKETSNANLLTHYTITKIIDGDSIWVKNKFTKDEFEVRLNGIDAPELKKCPKLLQDERETHLAGQLLMKLGRLSLHHLLEVAPISTSCTIKIEHQNSTDLYGRTLAYIYLPDGRCLNELMVSEGYAKPYNRYYCEQLNSYQTLNNIAKQEKKGLYNIVDFF
jgi:micrococcal nuclease